MSAATPVVTTEDTNRVKAMIQHAEKYSKSGDGREAMQCAQAALNAANTLAVLATLTVYTS